MSSHRHLRPRQIAPEVGRLTNNHGRHELPLCEEFGDSAFESRQDILAGKSRVFSVQLAGSGFAWRPNQLDAATGFRSELSGLALSAAACARATVPSKQDGCWRSWWKNSATSAVTSGDHRPLETTKSTPSGSRTIPMIYSEVSEDQIVGRLFVQVHPLSVADSKGTQALLVVRNQFGFRLERDEPVEA